MLHRSTGVPLLILAISLVLLAGILVGNGILFSGVTQPVVSLTWVGIALITQLLIGYSLWWVLRRRQQSMETEVLHSIVHEFQTPVTAIRMAADILSSPIARNHPERTDKYVRIILEETERLQHQVETMLTLARADRNTLVLNPEPIQLHQLLHSVAERHGDYLTLSLLRTDPYILADRIHLTNVLYNLLDNAIKYSSTEPSIMMETQLSSDGLTIMVRDRGVGIPPHLISQIFQPFFRVHDQNQPSVKGFGLGLSYVQRIVKSHNWTIWVRSEVEKGSEFIIHIPPSAILTCPVSSTAKNHPL
ncbi:HAMP domain-containing sensor histidine kinase [Spirosoma sp.]|uniref:sensor histidine kinase n=1 Tax=Spirosoma sp. TaxID=1899569 RepID=UPI0026364980|nr:HAMP domain-containing sensor histidine kinase [Spirosoma sp.]MCX6217943.1 HAMP domain-containing sensor histidine kinase [Spirosoma sp.]